MGKRSARLELRLDVKFSMRSNAPLFKMKFVKMSHPRTAVLSVTDSAPKSQNRNAGMFLVVSARLLMRKSVTLLPDKSVKRFTTLRFVVTSGPRSASRCPRRRGNARQWKKKSVKQFPGLSAQKFPTDNVAASL